MGVVEFIVGHFAGWGDMENWSWLWILSPLWIIYGGVLGLWFFMATLLFLVALISGNRTSFRFKIRR
jgi:hypothetical protein